MMPKEWFPILYAIAMMVDGLAALVFGYIYDRKGMAVLLAGAAISVPVAPLVFLGGFDAVLIVFSVGIQLAALPLLYLVIRRVATDRSGKMPH